MKKARDFFDEEIELGDSIIVQDGSSIAIGKASHYSAKGNLIIRCYPYNHNPNNIYIWKRVIDPYLSRGKLVITIDPKHIHFTRNIKIREE